MKYKRHGEETKKKITVRKSRVCLTGGQKGPEGARRRHAAVTS